MYAVVFEMDERRYALAASIVERIAPVVEVEPIPGAPPVIEGVIDVHGRFAAVFDLRRRFGRPERPPQLDGHFIIAWAGPRLVAIRADRATEVTEIDADVIEPVARTATAAPGIHALAHSPDGTLLIHDPAAFLTLAESELLDRALERAVPKASGPG